MTTPLPIDVDATDWTADPDKGAVEHRQWHDTIHGKINDSVEIHVGTTPPEDTTKIWIDTN